MIAAHQPMDTSNSIMERDIHPNSIAATVGEMNTGFSPRAHHPRSIFQKRDICDRSSSNICNPSSTSIYCCPSDYTCYYDGIWKCDPNILGLTRGQKIGIGIGVTVAFFALCIIGLVIFFCCCRKVVQVASGAVGGHNNNNQGGYAPQPFTENTSYYAPPPQQGGKSGYEQYGQQQQYPPPPQNLYSQSTAPTPPYQQPPPPQGGYH